jgi:hypothetical protein
VLGAMKIVAKHFTGFASGVLGGVEIMLHSVFCSGAL